ncbi:MULTISPECIES: hypothetical protein [Actinosynnema]|uniref:hypothetical protein n=1 Tax=Actinosynnema TaxID=40566 RepID=UPI0020A4B763|nr:hypothetical protein [Actinosynnema pretiosum]MCP2092134.1 hypothetical protein [Actinosynnema pretiosum]
MSALVLMSGRVWVARSRVHVLSGSTGGPPVDDPAAPESFDGQSNGLCGAGAAGRLVLVTGLRTGQVDFEARLHDGPPPLGAEWEEAVEVSFRPTGPVVRLATPGGGRSPELHLPETDYRVRYCATGVDAGAERDTVLAHEQPVDRYLLDLWPAPPEPDRVLRQRAAYSARKHQRARDQRPSGWEAREWGGELPGERLRELRGPAMALARLNRPLLDALAERTTGEQRAVARWAARQACAVAGLTAVPWIAEALAAAERGMALPAPFDGDQRRAWDRLYADPAVPTTTVECPFGGPDNRLRHEAAFPAVLALADPDPLGAACEALWAAAVALGPHERDGLLERVREALSRTGPDPADPNRGMTE